MQTKDDIQSFLERVEGGTVDATEIEPGLWRAKTQTGAEFIVNYAPPVVILRVRVMESPADETKQRQLYRTLLEFNARELVHGSYGLEGEHIVLTDALELADLDFLEFEASWDSLTLALASHLSAFAPYRER
jgi:Tir chaperone family protein CesT